MAVTATLLADSPVESVKQTIKSTSTCSNATLLSLQNLLRGSLKPLPSSSPEIEGYTAKRNARSANGSVSTTRSRATIRGSKSNSSVKSAAALNPQDGVRLSCQEKLALATEVFNTTLKTLSDACKVDFALKRQPQRCDNEKTQKTRLPENCHPQPPLPNRVVSSPRKSRTSRKIPPTTSGPDDGVLATAECARLALSCLRALKSENVAEGNGYPNLQLEQGTCVLAGRLISLGINDLAYKELRGLKRRIQHYLNGNGTGVGRHTTTTTTMTRDDWEEETGKERMSDILTFSNIANAKSIYGLLVTFQSNALRLIASERRVSTVQNLCPSLQFSSPSSPAKAILAALEAGVLSKDKAALQLQLLSNTLVSLCSWTENPGDGRSSSSREQMKPVTILTLQLLSLEVRCLGWQVSGHTCDEGKEMLDPLARYLGNFTNRTKEVEKSDFVAIYKVILQLQSAVAATKRRSKTDSNSAVKITTILGQLAQEAGCFDEALRLFAESLTPLSFRQSLSLATVRCKIASVHLQALKSGKSSEDHSLSNALLEATTALGLSLKGSPGDLDELLVEAAKLKKLTMSWFGNVVAKDDKFLEKNDIPMRVYEYLHGFVRFLRRYIGRQPSPESETWERESFQKRASLSKNVALAAVDSALAVGKLSVMSRIPYWEDFLPISSDCYRLLITLQSTVDGDLGSPEVDNCGTGLVKLSNLFWSRYLKEKELGKGYSDLLPLLKQSTGLLSSCSSSLRNNGFAALKFERLAHLHLEGNMVVESEKAFRQSIREHVDSGILDQLLSDSAHDYHQDPKSNGFALGRVLSAFLKMKVRRSDSRPQDVFDDDMLGFEKRGYILEWQMRILAESHAHTCNDEFLRFTFSALVSRLLDLYSPERNPIRRSRVILCALRFTLEYPSILDPTFVRILVDEGTKSYDDKQELTEGDFDMERFATHIKNSLRLTLGLHDGTLKPDELGEVVSSWTCMIRYCHDWKAVESCVDYPEYWVLQMKALVDYTEVHGLWELQFSVLELMLRIMELQDSGDFSDAIIILSRLALQCCRLGHCKKAGNLLASAGQYLGQRSISCLAIISYKVAQVEYLLETGDVGKAASTLSAAQTLYEEAREKEDLASCNVQSKIAWERLVADAVFMHSQLSCAQGSISNALFFAKLSVRLNCRIWAKVERLSQKKLERFQHAAANSEIEAVTEGISKLDVSHCSTLPDSSAYYSQGAPFWPHISSHHTCLLNLANLSAHHGLFQDAIYYGEQALKLNKTLHANVRQTASQVQLGSHWILGGHILEGQGLLEAATETSKQLGNNVEHVSLRMGLAALYRVQGHYKDEYDSLVAADNVISGIINSEGVDSVPVSSVVSDLEDRMEKLRIQGSGRRPQQQQQATTGRRTRTMTSSSRSGSRKVPKASDNSSGGVQSKSLLQQRSDVLLRQASCSHALRDFEKAALLLNDARKLAVSKKTAISLHIGETEHLLASAARGLAAHQVYCVLPESTISLPSLQSADEVESAVEQPRSSTRSHTTKGATSHKQKTPGKGTTTRSRTRKVPEDFSALLSKAGDSLNGILAEATVLGSTLDNHTACRLMSRVSMLSHVTASEHPTRWSQSPANVNEISRIGAFVREKTAIDIDKKLADYLDPLLWPKSSISNLEPDVDICSDFEKRYVDILPNNWNVLSLSLSADNSEFVISKLQRDRPPFLLRLPLKRGNCDDEDEQFTFEDGRDEMKEIIKLANESAHAARSQADKDSKREWWRNRESIDRRLETLLQNIENVWFGGFRGIFTPSPQDDDDDHFSRFASSFHGILDKHLPSRRKGGGRSATGPKLTLHRNVLALFLGLRDLQNQEDPEEILMDLLYFVVDILQFQGERNAYDEIDFDMMVVETLDALRSYHDGARNEREKQLLLPQHTILILDKALHFFPWESLPSLQGLPVCRVPSLECLRDRVLQIRGRQTEGDSARVLVDRAKGSYILNPAGDLKTTQGTFESKLSAMGTWSGIVNREPTEEEFRNSLESKDLLLYFGHGSGAQYIRGRTIKRLSRCAVTFLMGCSSGTMTEAGEYEAYGTPMNYLHAGSPALVATLWDVTDKDIDRFAKSTFDNWGLMSSKEERESLDDGGGGGYMEVAGTSAGKGKRSKSVKSSSSSSGSGDHQHSGLEDMGRSRPVALDEAVSKSRGSCLLKYLNGSAPVIYGVPVFLE